MTVYDPGDVVLVRLPFTGLTSSKKRPAVVVSRREFASHQVEEPRTSPRRRDVVPMSNDPWCWPKSPLDGRADEVYK
jgi:hypothetical protein